MYFIWTTEHFECLFWFLYWSVVTFSSPLIQRGGEGHVHPQNLAAPPVSGSGRSGGQQPALSAAERHHPENFQWGDVRRAQALPVHCCQTADGQHSLPRIIAIY